MNQSIRYFIIILVVALVIGAGGFVFLGSKQGEKIDQMTNQSEMADQKPVAQSHRSYELDRFVYSSPSVVLQTPVTISFRIKNDKGEILKNFAIAHEKIMHFIVVRKDLQHFQHLHPTFNQDTGDFTVEATFPAAGPYRMFPDFTPDKSADNPQLLPVTLFSDKNVGDLTKYQPLPVTPDTQKTKTFSGYDITFLFNSAEGLVAQKDVVYSFNVEKGGQPVSNLEKYLGALGHSVVLRQGNLDFIHTHTMEASAQDTQTNPAMMGHVMKPSSQSSLGPTIDFATSFPEPGNYKIFTQFQHQGKIITTDYAIKVN